MGAIFCILGVAVALFPSNYEISGMDEDESQNQSMKMQTIQRVNKMQTIDVDFEPYPLRVTFSENGIYSCKIVKSIEYSILNKLTTSEKNVLDGLYSWIESYQSGTFDCELLFLIF